MILANWAKRWNIPDAAMYELRWEMGVGEFPAHPGPSEITTEFTASKNVRLTHAKAGGILWRNNVGVLNDERGIPVRFGLANDSKQMNEKVKSSDLIGLSPVIITEDMVGDTFGRFVAREVKKPGWKYTGTPRERAQKKFIEIVISFGGDAAFTTGS